MLASRIFSSGIKETFLLTLASGRTIKASGNHQFLTLAGWQRLDALQEGDRLAAPRFLKPSAPPSRLSLRMKLSYSRICSEMAVYCRDSRFTTQAQMKKNLDAVEHAARQLFGITPRRIRQKNWWHTYLPSPYRLTHGRPNPITAWYRTLGLQSVRSYENACLKQCSQLTVFLFNSFCTICITDGNISWKKLTVFLQLHYYASSSKGSPKTSSTFCSGLASEYGTSSRSRKVSNELSRACAERACTTAFSGIGWLIWSSRGYCSRIERGACSNRTHPKYRYDSTRNMATHG